MDGKVTMLVYSGCSESIAHSEDTECTIQCVHDNPAVVIY